MFLSREPTQTQANHSALRFTQTGSTYLQRNFKSKRETLLSHGILYLGPTTFKKQFRYLWKHLQWEKSKKEPSQKLTDLTLKALIQEAGPAPDRIHTIFISFEAIFGTLRAGLIQKNRKKNSNRENKLGLYRYSKRRIKRLMRWLECTLGTEEIDWTYLLCQQAKGGLHSFMPYSVNQRRARDHKPKQ